MTFTLNSPKQLYTSKPVNDDSWHHVVFTRRQSDGTLKVYLDGKYDAIGTGTAGGFPCRFFSLGRGDLNNYEPNLRNWQIDTYWERGLDEVKIFSKELNEVEAAKLFSDRSIAPEDTTVLPPHITPTPTVTPTATPIDSHCNSDSYSN
jgi:hypothetical protein